jgi:hypothetical protein
MFYQDRLGTNKRQEIGLSERRAFHTAMWSGLTVIGSEVGENIDSIQAHFAFNRGAARQFHLPWFIDFSVRFCPKPVLANDRHLFSLSTLHDRNRIGMPAFCTATHSTPQAVRKTPLFAPFIFKNEHFTKTGSGQT